jgi:hypothetical protein
MDQDIPQLRFGTAVLATGPKVHSAEQGDPGGKAIVDRPLPELGAPRSGSPATWMPSSLVERGQCGGDRDRDRHQREHQGDQGMASVTMATE